MKSQATTTNTLIQVVSVLGFLAVWEAVSRTNMVSPLIPPPSSILSAFRREQADGIWSANVAATAGHYVWGVLIGTVAGIALGYAAALSPVVEACQEGVARLLRPIPPLAWVPFAIIWFGISELAAAFIIAIGAFWVNYFSAYSGVQAIDRRLFEMCATFGQGGWWARVIKVVIPGSAPSVLAGIRSGLGIGWFAVLAAELFGIPGIGQRMQEASGMLATDVVLLYMATIALCYTACDAAMVLVSRRMLQWLA
ncbi:ABC transporter permease [Xanthobacter sp. KR7-225]|uniref:ABC transporter permease n=1 Tax=Xanthobacter sp. KR7-225 TaxID=3156613 RepID=UPI0032B5EF54